MKLTPDPVALVQREIAGPGPVTALDRGGSCPGLLQRY